MKSHDITQHQFGTDGREEGEVEGTSLFSDWTADLFEKLRIVFQVH